MSIKPIPFGRGFIGPGYPVMIIAEIGINHEGDAAVCQAMIKAAADAGADAVKLQIVKADVSYAPGTDSHKIFKQAELTPEETGEVFTHARNIGVEIFATCGDSDSLDVVEQLHPAAYKISSGLMTHIPLIQKAARTGRTLLMSTGMAELQTIEQALQAAKNVGALHIGIFQCTSIYPAPPETLQLASIAFLEHQYQLPAGFSDHSQGIMASTLAVASGARMIEKHFSLDSSRPGYDHKVSLSPDEFKELVQQVRLAEKMMGSYGKSPADIERAHAKFFYRKLVAKHALSKGTLLKEEDVGIMRIKKGQNALNPSELPRVVGRRLKHHLEEYAPLTEDDFA